MIDHRPSSYNRSYFETPIQGNGRDAFDYGRTGFKPEPYWTLSRIAQAGFWATLFVVAGWLGGVW